MVMLSRLNRDGCEPDAQGSEAARKAEIMADAGWLAQFGHIHHYLDFLVETADEMLICEVKARNELDDPVVRAKAKAACLWVDEANKIAIDAGKKRWRYLLIPHDAVTANSTLAGLVARYGLTAT